jgi:hypothetical protein
MSSILGSHFYLLTSAAQPQEQPIFVKIGHSNPVAGLKDVVLGSLGLAGVIALLAVLSGCLLAGVLFWIRARST